MDDMVEYDDLVLQSIQLGKDKDLDVDRMREVLQLVWLDCHMAIEDMWDRSDDGFDAIIKNIEEVLGR